MTDHKALIRRAQSGDGGAFEQLLETHYDMLYRFAYKWCGNRADAQDYAARMADHGYSPMVMVYQEQI